MKLVLSVNYYDYCDSWDNDYYIEYSSAEKLLCDFEDWCKHKADFSCEGFLGLGIFPQNLHGTSQHSQLKIFTWDEWWERKFTKVEEL
jgi:hypothetical protein